MKLGFVSAILAELTFEELVNYAYENGFCCIEAMCWPVGKAERRYAGVTHIDVSSMDNEKVAYIKQYLSGKKVKLSALGYYPNPLDPDPVKAEFYCGHIKEVIKAAAMLDINMVTTFIGRNQYLNTAENLKKFKEVWTPIIKFAEDNKVKIAIENCPMLFTKDEWPGGQNLATTPAIWRKMFELVPSEYFGLNYDPSHFIWQRIDYIKPVYEFRDKIFHVHFKDIKIYEDKLKDVGIMATPLEYISPKLPGLGDVNWGRFISALTDIGYRGAACIEVEDKAFEDSLSSRKKALEISKKNVGQFI